MLKNLIVISLRALGKRKFYSMLNIAGLAVSIAFSFLLWVYVKDQNSYDHHYKNAERIFRVNAVLNMNGKEDVYSNGPRPVAPLFKTDFPEVEEAVRIKGVGGLEIHTGLMEVGEKRVVSRQMFVADSTVFKVFDREFIAGDPSEALREPNSLVISESLARNIFGSANVMGKTVDLRTEGKFLKITGIIKDDSRRTHLPMDAMVSWTTFPRDADMTQWYGAHVYTYILLREGSDPEALRAKIPAFYTKYMKAEFDKFDGKADLMFQPLLSIYLAPELVWEAYPHGSKSNVMALGLVIAFLLIFACINYVNLATARSMERASEVGIRKVLGSPKGFLILQFLSESILLSVVSGVMAFVISWIMLPYFITLTGFQGEIFETRYVVLIFLISIGIGLIAGIYPALYLSSLRSVESLKGKFSGSMKGEALRKTLVASQYFIAATLIASILFVWEQTRYIKNKDIGYDKNNLLSIMAPDDTTVLNHMSAFAEKLKGNSNVLSATTTFFQLDKEANHFSPTLENEDGTTFQMGADFIIVDYDFIETVDAELLHGRTFNPGSKADERTFLINEAAMIKFGWTENPLGNRFKSWSARENDGEKLELIGVVKDFNLGVSYHNVNPLIIFLTNESAGNTLYVRLREDAAMEGIKSVRQLWAETFPDQQPEISFLDQSLNALYNKEERFLNLLSAFSAIILLIASLGIIGLISFTTVQKKKEIAVRKVLGSSLKSIIWLLSRKFLGLLVLANLVALPVTYFLINEWLGNFTYRISFHVWPFAVGLLVCVSFTILSLFYHAFVAANANPVEALRSE